MEGDPKEQKRVLDPCLPRGYVGELFGVAVEGGGYFGLCRQVAAGLVMGNCSSVECGLGGFLLPPLTGVCSSAAEVVCGYRFRADVTNTHSQDVACESRV